MKDITDIYKADKIEEKTIFFGSFYVSITLPKKKG